jgi:alkylation response protein AidB-like acyl-CoA dehydrogenase
MSVAATPELQALQAALLDWSKRTDSIAAIRAMEQGQASPDLSVLEIIGPDEIADAEAPAQTAAAACEQLAGSLVPGPVLPTLLAALLGVSSSTAAVGFDNSKTITVARQPDGTLRVTGQTGPVLCADSAATLILGAGDGWFRLDRNQPGVTVTPLPALDFSRGLASVQLDNAAAAPIDGLSTEHVRDMAATLFAAEAAGIATWCSATATAYAKTRRQFGKLIGEFQAIRHLCAWMHCRTERAGALAWDAARAADQEPGRHPLAASRAAARGLDDAVENAKDCIQVLGGIGFTWEHDAHLYLRRALAIRALLSGDRTSERGAAWTEEPLLGDEGRQHQKALAGEGANKHGIGAWAIPAIKLHGTQEQQDRFIPPTLTREIVWCQLFSEPEAGSDLAGLRTRAIKTAGGWRLTGQKVWTSLANQADWAICLARTDPDVPKREGLSYFAVDMHADGIEVRPLREITGRSMFNEVFLDDVFVADDCLIGAPGDGWRVAMSTLATERETIGGGDVLAQRGVHPAVRKLLGVADRQDAAEAALTALGPAGAVASLEAEEFLLTRCLSIAGGTTQILLNQVAERVLGLPKDPH